MGVNFMKENTLSEPKASICVLYLVKQIISKYNIQMWWWRVPALKWLASYVLVKDIMNIKVYN